MRGGPLRALVASAVLAVVALAVAYPERMVSPGALIPAHAGIEKDCFACHAPWRGAASERCTRCHRLADIGLRTTRGVALGGSRRPSTMRCSRRQCRTVARNATSGRRTACTARSSRTAGPVTARSTGSRPRSTTPASSSWTPITTRHAQPATAETTSGATPVTGATSIGQRRYAPDTSRRASAISTIAPAATTTPAQSRKAATTKPSSRA